MELPSPEKGKIQEKRVGVEGPRTRSSVFIHIEFEMHISYPTGCVE